MRVHLLRKLANLKNMYIEKTEGKLKISYICKNNINVFQETEDNSHAYFEIYVPGKKHDGEWTVSRVADLYRSVAANREFPCLG